MGYETLLVRFFSHEPMRKKRFENGFYDNSIELVTLIFVQPFLGPIVITLNISDDTVAFMKHFKSINYTLRSMLLSAFRYQ